MQLLAGAWAMRTLGTYLRYLGKHQRDEGPWECERQITKTSTQRRLASPVTSTAQSLVHVAGLATEENDRGTSDQFVLVP